MKIKIFISLFVSVVLCFIIACVSPPKAELEAAEKAVKDAGSANANKYAKKEYQSAKESLNLCKENYDKGNKKNKLALKYALDAKEKADTAYFKSNKEITVYKLKTAEKSKKNAEESFAKELVPEKYNEALKDLQKSEQLLKEAETDVKKLKMEEEAMKNAAATEK